MGGWGGGVGGGQVALGVGGGGMGASICGGAAVVGSGALSDGGGIGGDGDGRGEQASGVAGSQAGRSRVLQVQRARSRDRDAGDTRPATRKELDEVRLASRLDAQRVFATHARDVEALLGAQTERVIAIVGPLMEAVVETNVRGAKFEGGQDERLVRMNGMTEHVAELTTRLATAETAAQSSSVIVAETLHVVGTLREEMALTEAQAHAPLPSA